ncbi:topoisomerase C-terminal repeat-containing protein [Parabacteroides johnsonii]|uniref:type IA DNA topoisomerase n=1 Tax=Parabacteroides johnsonii TaxID=387661 RepID=UPI001D13EF02|nr:type IA DNA topoisomerase [Parabacteroides johnsonii]UEA89328.1 topoisomerase C-terminal repeat-containing protein [Parabacteroides johnsonii]UWP41491.1 DNA topoisomerase [Parabacteroides johnsonii DSM 18315]
MITILAEKPSVAREIARIVGAMKREEGYFTGNGYHVTWALGHLVQLALPDGYGIKGFRRDSLPVIPENFELIPRQVKTDKGYKADAAAVKQIKVITKLWNESDGIIVATDCAREGELIFRYLYAYIGCTLPFRRLWISSLTDAAIRKGLKELKDGREYDNLYQAAKARSEADWLVGINGTQALSVAAGRGTYSVGRVQTPTLAMVCQRFWENKRFQPEPVHQLHFTTPSVNTSEVVKFASVEKWKDKEEAATLYNKVKEQMAATVTKVEKKEKVENPPLLYDLTTLQKEANTKHGFTAEQTLALVQKLYEAKLVTYPRTSSRYIPEDVFDEVPLLFDRLAGHSSFAEKIEALDKLNRRSVDASKVTDHHALLVTPNRPLALYKDEQLIYDMIVGRMIEAFSSECVKDTTTVRAECAGVAFETKGCIVRKAGWRSVYGEDKEDTVLPGWKEGDTLAMNGCSMSSGMTRPKPLHTESTLLAAMETAGREGVEDEEVRQALKDCGIGTPATRAAIIETLLKREYMVRVKKSLVPTEKGLALYSIVRGMDIADVEMTGRWEEELAEIEKGRTPHEAFIRDIEGYTRKITTELLASDKLFGHKASGCVCPKCGTGTMQFYGKVVRCDNPDCALPVFRQMAGRTLTDAEMNDLLTQGRTGVLGGFKSRQGKPFSAMVTFDADFNTKFVFPEAKSVKKSTYRKGGRK